MTPSPGSVLARPAAPPKRLGSETPRIFTPPLRELTDDTSLGFAVIEFARTVVGVDLHPWQKWLYIHALELLPDGALRFRIVLVLVARQNGKSLWSQVLALYFMYVLATKLVVGTAQDLDIAEEILQGAVDMVEATPALDAAKSKVVNTNGKRALVLKSGERWKVKAANRKAGRSLTCDLALLDELREHQTWEAWKAISKTTTARSSALIVGLSSAGDASSVVLRYLRMIAHLALGDPDGINADADPSQLLAEPEDDEDDDDLEVDEEDTLGIFEWSGVPGCDRKDRDGWSASNPSLGYTISERTIAGFCRTDPEWVFRGEVLCQWNDGAGDGPFPSGAWEDGTDKASQIVGHVKACVEVSADQSKSHIVFAGRRADGLAHVEVVASRPGTGWVLGWLQDSQRAQLVDEVALRSRGAPVTPLLEVWREAGLPIVEWSGSDLTAATVGFYTLVRDGELFHLPQPLLDVAAATAATKPSGDGLWLWDTKNSHVDIAALWAATGAVWLLGRPVEAPTESVYESRGLVVL